jgi:hypothetical protein
VGHPLLCDKLKNPRSTAAETFDFIARFNSSETMIGCYWRFGGASCPCLQGISNLDLEDRGDYLPVGSPIS